MEEEAAKNYVLDYFPKTVEYVVLNAAVEDLKAAYSNYECKVRLNIRSTEEFKKWMEDFQEISGVTFRVMRTKPRKGTQVLYKADYRCHHNTHPEWSHVKRPSKKHTQCPAILTVTVKVVSERCRSIDQYRQSFPTEVKISSHHNHQVGTAASLKFRDPADHVKVKFLRFFQLGYTPHHAWKAHKMDILESEEAEDFAHLCADRRVCPDMRWIYYFYESTYKKKHQGSEEKAAMMACLKAMVDKYTDGKASVVELDEEDVAVIVCTNFMERVHFLRNSETICFLDGSGNVDRYHCKVYVLMVNTDAGGLPLGVFITTSWSEKVVSVALEEFKRLLSESVSFGERGTEGPQIFVTEAYASAERGCLKKCFPSSVSLVCPLRVLQAAWRWLWDESHDVKQECRESCYRLISDLVLSGTKEELESRYTSAMQSPLLKSLPKFEKYFLQVFMGYELWAVCCHPELVGRDDISPRVLLEMAFTVMRDNVFKGTRSYSLPQLFEFVTGAMSDMYKTKIFDAIAGKASPSMTAGRWKSGCFKITETGENAYSVFCPKSGQTYVMNYTVGCCSCPLGMTGAVCRHQHAVCEARNNSEEGDIARLIWYESKAKYYWIATGDWILPEDWYHLLGYENADELLKGIVSGAVSVSCVEEQNSPQKKKSSLDLPEDSVVPSVVEEEDAEGIKEAVKPPPPCDRPTCNKLMDEVAQMVMQFYDDDPDGVANAVTRVHKSMSSIRSASTMVSTLNAIKEAVSAAVQADGGSRRKKRKPGKCQQVLPPEHSYGKKKNAETPSEEVPAPNFQET